MRNPLHRRLLRELKSDFGKYAVIFLFMVLLIGLISGFLVSDNSMLHAYKEGFERYNVEDGHVAFAGELSWEVIKDLSENAQIDIYPNFYFEENMAQGQTVRVYEDREKVNTECLMKGEMPMAEDEIALDRMFADNNDLKVGDHLVLGGKTLKITGLIALPDYSCLFQSNSDMMFDSVNFSVAVMSKEGFEKFGSKHMTYNYAYKYQEDIDRNDKVKQKERAEKLLKDATVVIMKHSFAMGKEESESLEVTEFVPTYLNKAINFTGDDMGKDKIMFLIFDYIVTVVLAFVFAVTISNTITSEATTIGTLRASGYSRGELIRHYMVLPMSVTIVAAILGNILGYTVLKDYMMQMYYGSYSLPTATILWNAEAFLDTTVIPVILMFLINLGMLVSKLKLSPLRFLRKDLSKRGKKKAFRLNTKIPIMNRFRIRILFQNIPNYLTLFVGIFAGGVLVVFSLMFKPLLDDYAVLVTESKISDYQYVLMKPEETKIEGAEKYCMAELETMDESRMTDEVSIYGIEKDSAYIHATIPEGKVLINNGLSIKYGLKEGDTIALKDPFSSNIYEFQIGGVYTYDAAISIFVNRDEFNEFFGEKEDYFSGYFSNTELTDLDDDNVVGVITEEDLKKLSTQLTVSMGNFMELFRIFGVIMFLLLMFILSKQIIEKNSQSISMTKILGFYNGEIGSLYILATSVVVVASLLITIPLIDLALRFIFKNALYKMMSGYIPYIISNQCYVKMFLYGIGSYAAISVLQLLKISKISKAEALKNVE